MFCTLHVHMYIGDCNTQVVHVHVVLDFHVISHVVVTNLPYPMCVCVQVFVCHDSDTGMEMAVKVIDINHIDLRPHNLEAKRMQTVSIPCPCASCTCTCTCTCTCSLLCSVHVHVHLHTRFLWGLRSHNTCTCTCTM